MAVRKPVLSLSQQMPALTLAVLTGALVGIALLASACSASPVSSGCVPANNTAARSATTATEPGWTYSVTLNDSNQFQLSSPKMSMTT